jgi:outer membrane protein OmpA-like peptidoglycan-associated protein
MHASMKKTVALGLILAISLMACKARVQVQAKTPAPEPPKQEQPKPEPPKQEEPKQGEQIVLPEVIEFELNDSRIRETDKTLSALNKLADVMKAHPNITKLRIEGHTDASGKAKRNDKLSKARADAVAKWLADHGVDQGRLTTVGFGSKHPLVSNDTVEHRALNRRTEYYVDEVDGKKVDAQQTASGTTTGGKGTN